VGHYNFAIIGAFPILTCKTNKQETGNQKAVQDNEFQKILNFKVRAAIQHF